MSNKDLNVVTLNDFSDKQFITSDSIRLKTTNLAGDQLDFMTHTGFFRTNKAMLDGKVLPHMEMHIAHPNFSNNAFAKGIGFSYAESDENTVSPYTDDPFNAVVTAWDGNGQYLGSRNILTDSSSMARKEPTGWAKLPGRLLMQWGTFSGNSVSFPVVVGQVLVVIPAFKQTNAITDTTQNGFTLLNNGSGSYIMLGTY